LNSITLYVHGLGADNYSTIPEFATKEERDASSFGRRLTSLDLGLSPIASRNVQDIALFLSHILSKTCAFNEGEGNSESVGDRESVEYKTISKYRILWTKVKGHLPLLIRARDEERQFRNTNSKMSQGGEV